MKKVEYIVRSKNTRWSRKCKTLADAKALIKADWAFNTDKKVYIEKRVIDIVV